MYDSVLSNGTSELLNARLVQAIDRLRSLTISTRQDALAEIYSQINAVIDLGNSMTPLTPIPAFGPALVGSLTGNCSTLNEDASAIIQQLLDVENDASGLYNSFASIQNMIRQSLRERLVASSNALWREEFVTDTQMATGYTVNLDRNAAAASNPLASEVLLTPASVSAGVNSLGELDAASDWANLLDNDASTSLIWNGNKLELLINFNTATIINMAKIEILGYQGLVVEEFISSPDGVLIENILADLPPTSRSIDGDASKFAGDWFALFPPRHAKQIRITVRDVIGTGLIQIRNLILGQRKYSANGAFTSQPISQPQGLVRFEVDQHVSSDLTVISHQISNDGVSFGTITPGQVLKVVGDYWYRALFSRLEANFAQASSPLADPDFFVNYTVVSFATTDMGNGIIARKAEFSDITGTVDLQEVPIPGTVALYQGSTRVASSNYSVSGSLLTVTAEMTDVTLQYQTSAYATAGILSRQNYYTPLLYSVRFAAA